eukprot:jgi/Phyca11/555471/estExt2_Genewise1Plus.C_PHYCAscaffold_730116
MAIMVGDTVLISHDSVLLDAEKPVQVLVQYPAESERHDEWVTSDRFCGPKRLDAIAAWMNSVDDALIRLDQDIKNLEAHQASQNAQLNELERRKKEAIGQKEALEASVLQTLKSIRVAEETAMARKRLQNAGISQDEIDAILPVIRHESQH